MVLACSSADAAEILILAGDATQDGGKKAFDATVKEWARWQDVIMPAPGFPKLIDSSTVEGLKPGFFITALGVCEKQGVLLDVARATMKGPYVRQVKWPDAKLPCPTFQNVVAKSAKTKHGELLVVATGHGARIVLIGKDGSITAEDAAEGNFGMGCTSQDLTVDGSTITFDAHCATQSCTSPEESDITVTIRAQSPTEIKQKSRSFITAKCMND